MNTNVGPRQHRLWRALMLQALVALAACASPPRSDSGALPPATSPILGTPVLTTATLAPSEAPTMTLPMITTTAAPPSATATAPTMTARPPSATPELATVTAVPPTAIPTPPTASSAPPSATPPPPTATPMPPSATVAPAAETAVEQEVLALLNVARAAEGCAEPLAAAPELRAAALRHSRDMAAGDFLDHIGSDGSDAGRRIEEAGYNFGLVDPGAPLWAENIAAGQPDARSVAEAWLASPSHRANILICDLTAAGVGLATREGGAYPTYWTIVFAAGR